MTIHRVWVFIEQQGGRAHPVSWELLAVANDLAKQLKTKIGSANDTVSVECVLLGNNIPALARDAISFGAERVYLVEHPVFEQYMNAPYCKNVTALAKKYTPTVFLIGATNLGRDLAGAVATSLETGLTADCTDIVVDEVDRVDHPLLLATRPAFGGNILATIVCRERLPQMASVRPRVFPVPPKSDNAVGEVISEKAVIDFRDRRVEILERIQIDRQGINLEYADIIVSGGRGLGDASGFKMLQELADVLGGKVGATRPCVDAGWIAYEHQVGQTGKTVRPKLYIAAGISGALQHKVGAQNADFIIAINKDPHAPIFDIADMGIVGDLYEVIPEMIAQVRQQKESELL